MSTGTRRESEAGRLGSPGLVIGLLGPTGVGKTAVAVELAARLLSVGRPSNSEQGPQAGSPRARARIISCDSMQIYRRFPVLTNQPLADACAEIRHDLVGFLEPGQEFSAAAYAQQARPLIVEDLAAQGWALVVGGTGLYMRAALAPLAVAAEKDPALRAQLEAQAVSQGPEVLHEELAAVDAEAARAIDPRNIRRVLRALEVVKTTGKAWSGRSDLWAPVYEHPTLVVGLVVAREELYRRIDARAEATVRGGAVEEVRRFRACRGHEATRPGLPGICSAIGYAEICRLLAGEQDVSDTVAQVAAATRRYARRQLTWLRKLKDAVIIDTQDRSPGEVAQEILALVLSRDEAGEHGNS